MWIMEHVGKKKGKKKIQSCHHTCIRWILKIKWNKVGEQRIKNSWVRKLFCNTPNIKAFVERRTAWCIGKITKAPEEILPKQFLGAWINQLGKTGQPQLLCNNNFVRILEKILPNHVKSREAIFREWLRIAKDEVQWKWWKHWRRRW